ncbi:MAG: glycosyltransferase [Acidobacteria bacterium]|nr:glycosyltransferase [Acidobacteriota bacterium]
MRPARLLQINTERGWRGGEVQTLLLSRGLMRRGHQCLIVAPPASLLATKARDAGVPVEPVPSRGEFDLVAVLAIARLLRRFRPDLIHYHTSHAITLGTLSSFASGRIPTVASRRVSFSLSRNPLAAWKYTHRVDRIIAVSEGIRRLLLSSGIPRERITVIHSAIDLDRFRQLPDRQDLRHKLGYAPQDFVVGSVGHLAEHKGHSVLVEAAGRLSAEPHSLRYLIVGRGERQEAVRRKVQTLGLEKVFRLMGFSEEVADILPALDMFVFPSLSGEGSPAVLKEAMACGLPIVASAISGVEEVIHHGQEGLLVAPGDAVALSAAILMVASDRSLGIQCGRLGREAVRRYGVDQLVDQTESLYGELLEGRRR